MVTRKRNPRVLRFPRRVFSATAVLIALLAGTSAFGAMLYKDYVVRYDRGWDILCDPYEVRQGDWVLKIFRQKGEIAHEDFRDFLGIFQRLNPHVKDIDRLRPGQVVDIPLKKLVQGHLPGQSSGVVTIPFVMITNPREMIKKQSRAYTVQRGDTVSRLIASQFGGRFGNRTYNEGLKLFKAVNPKIKDVNKIFVGQKIYMPDPSVREQSWYESLFDKAGNLVEKVAQTAATETMQEGRPSALPSPAPAPMPPSTPVAPPKTTGPAAEAASIIGGRLMAKGTYYLPMKQGNPFELDLSRFPVIELQNRKKVILTTQDRVMNVDLPLIQSYWTDVKIVKIGEEASAQAIVEAVLSAFAGEKITDRLAFDDGGVSVIVTAKWIHSAPSANGQVPRHTCITPITSANQQTHAAIRRYLDQNDIVIKDLLTGTPVPAPAPMATETDGAAETGRIDGSNQKTLIEAFARRMGFYYSPNTSISFPYAGIQVQALSNLLSFGNGREILVDLGDLYGEAITAIRDIGLDILQLQADTPPITVIAQLLDAAGMSYTREPVFYGADRPAEFNTALTVQGILVPTGRGENLLFTEAGIPELIGDFIRSQEIRIIEITTHP
ncbi:LysM peptidoglycan-binding domain-containing protein [Desulfosarcina ovata]|nr:LysM peptidoglycan-binding domain-containing protein [Desulfosarcina ovata]